MQTKENRKKNDSFEFAFGCDPDSKQQLSVNIACNVQCSDSAYEYINKDNDRLIAVDRTNFTFKATFFLNGCIVL